MGVIKYPAGTQITTHFNSNEFSCPHCGITRISKELVNKLEALMAKVHASKCIISSGYRCPYYDKQQNGFAGRHSEGLAVDCCFYDREGKIIPSKVMCCVAYDMGFTGIAYIDKNYLHLDIRTNGTYYGDESRGNSSYWTDPYKYFHVSKEEVEKYTGKIATDNLYQSHGLKRKWYPNVKFGNGDYAGVFGVTMDGLYIDKYKYRARVNGKWLPTVTGRSDYAGILGYAITDIAISGKVKYRVHLKNGKRWLPWVDGKNYNINDYHHGYAGNGSIIDAIEIKEYN